MLESWNIGIMGEKHSTKVFFNFSPYFFPMFQHSIIPMFQYSGFLQFAEGNTITVQGEKEAGGRRWG
jgi:hypothetical protein